MDFRFYCLHSAYLHKLKGSLYLKIRILRVAVKAWIQIQGQKLWPYSIGQKCWYSKKSWYRSDDRYWSSWILIVLLIHYLVKIISSVVVLMGYGLPDSPQLSLPQPIYHTELLSFWWSRKGTCGTCSLHSLGSPLTFVALTHYTLLLEMLLLIWESDVFLLGRVKEVHFRSSSKACHVFFLHCSRLTDNWKLVYHKRGLLSYIWYHSLWYRRYLLPYCLY